MTWGRLAQIVTRRAGHHLPMSRMTMRLRTDVHA